MSFSIEQFRVDFPEFTDEEKYSDSMLTFWSSLGDQLLNSNRWGDIRDYGLYLYTAHHVVIAAMNIDDVAAGDNPGSSGGIISSESVGGVSVSMDTGATLETDAGYWNMTIYGKQFYRLFRIVGSGGVFV